MDSFSISDLQQLSGIKAHTIRIWEQRYNALQPVRSEGNTRSYDNSQLRRLLNIAGLMEENYKISELCKMTDPEIYKLLKSKFLDASGNPVKFEFYISQMIDASMRFDEIHFEKLFANALLRFGMQDTYKYIIYPLLDRMGMLWSVNNLPPAQEHFVCNLIRQKISTAIDSLPPARGTKNSWVLFLPENEFHEIALLFAHYILRKGGKRVTYLGANVPIDSLVKTVDITGATHLYFFLVHHTSPEHFIPFIKDLRRIFTKSKIHASANRKLVSKLNFTKDIDWISSVEELEKRIN